MKILLVTIPMPGRGRGWGNGYVGVHPGHPWHGKDYQQLANVECPGGLTYSDSDLPSVSIPDSAGYWWVGFDTYHCWNTPQNSPRSYVVAETEKLAALAAAAVPSAADLCAELIPSCAPYVKPEAAQ